MMLITVDVYGDWWQAPESMKSVVQAAWLLTTALGDVIVVIVAGVKLFTQVTLSVCLSVTHDITCHTW